MAHERLRFPDAPQARARTLPTALREPIRVAILAGVGLMVVGALLPWVHAFRPGTGWYDLSGFDGAGDGGIVLEFALVIGLLTWSSRAWNSRIGAVVAAPAALALASLVVLRLSWDNTEVYLRLLENAGGHGTYQPGFWIAGLGSLTAAVGGGVAIWRARGRATFSHGATAYAVGVAIGGAAGGIGGFIAGTRIADLFTAGSPRGASMILVFLAIALGFVGAWFGARIGGGAARSIRPS